MDNSNKTMIAVSALVAALFVGMNRAADRAPLSDWWLPLLLCVIGVAFGVSAWSDVQTNKRILAEAREKADAEARAKAAATRAVTPVKAAPPPPPTPSPAAAVIDQSAGAALAADHAETIEHTADTQARSDTMASLSHEDATDLQDPVENVNTTPGSTLEEGGELAGTPTDSQPMPAVSAREAGQTKPAAAPKAAKPKTTKPKESKPKAAKPKATKAKAAPDDLTRIEGIGPKMSAALVAAGIDTFAKLAAQSEDSLRAAVQAAGMRLAPGIGTWARQAALAATDNWDGLKTYQDTLKGGRES